MKAARGVRVRVADDATWQPCKTGTIVDENWRGKYMLVELDELVVEDREGNDVVVPGHELPPIRVRREDCLEFFFQSQN